MKHFDLYNVAEDARVVEANTHNLADSIRDFIFSMFLVMAAIAVTGGAAMMM